MAVVNKPLTKIEKPKNDRKPPSKEKIKTAIFLKKVLDTVFLFFILFLFHNIVMGYNVNIKYQDENNIIKYHDFGYAVYNKEEQLKDIYFYDGLNNNLDLIKFIQEKIVLQNDNALLVRLLSKEKTWYDNFIKIPGLKGKNNSSDLQGYNIRGIFTEENNDNKFLMIYSQQNGKETRYCFVVDTLSLTDVSAQCIAKSQKNVPVGFIHYQNFYFISIDKEIFVYDKSAKRIISVINTDSSVKALSTNEKGDIKVKMDKGDKEIRGVLIEYQIIKKNLIEKESVIHLHINNL